MISKNNTVGDILFVDGYSPLFDYLYMPINGISNKGLSLLLYSKCAGKVISPVVKRTLNENNEPDYELLADVLDTMYRYKWDTLYNTTKLEYDPIENYNMEEVEAFTGKEDGSGSNNESVSTSTSEESNKNQTGEQSGSGAVTSKQTGEDNDTVYGFNSARASNDRGKTSESQSTGENSSSSTFGQTDTANTTGSTEQTTEAGSTYDKSTTSQTTRTRRGNIGVMTSQDLLSKERAIANFNMINIIMDDISDFISMKIW